MSLLLLLPAVPGTRWTRAAEPWVAGPSSYLLVEGIVVEFSDELLFNRKFSKSKFLPAVGLELLNPALLGRRLIH